MNLILSRYWNYNIDGIAGTSWFLPAMFFTEILFVFMANIVGTKKISYSIYCVLVCVGFMTICKYNIKLLMAFDVLPFTLGFFAFGVTFKESLFKASLSIWFTILLAGIVAGCYWLPGLHCNVRTSTYFPPYIGWMVCLCVSVMIILIVKRFESIILKSSISGFIKSLGRNTLLIYLLHMEILRILPLNKIMFENVLLVSIVQCLITIGVLLLMIYIAKVINKHMAWTLGKF